MINLKTGTEISVELEQMQKRLLEIEKSVQTNLTMLNKRRSIPFGRSSDYGQREFTLKIKYDECNIEDWLKLTRDIHSLLKEYQTIRSKQWMLQKNLEVKKIEEVATIDKLINVR